MKINNPSSSRAYWFQYILDLIQRKRLSGSASAFDAYGLEESVFLYESSTLLPAAVPCPGGGMELHTASSEPQGNIHSVCKT